MEIASTGNDQDLVKLLETTGAVEVKIADKKAIQI